MSYRALYRKWRPAAFDEVAGQQHIVTILQNEVKENKLSHAYLFCGTRGTGKTSLAKILAKAVNCEHPKDGSPCNECESCRSVNNGSSVDVIELDAASNNGVDDVRRINDEVFFAPASSKYKVYIIDEVHMLTQSAFNALLKTIEEPPSHAIFILATTEFAKVPATIRSRCQRFDFRRIPEDVIASRLTEVCEGENIKISDDAVKLIAHLADGALRDALSILDQCFAATDDITYEKAAEITGVGSRTYLEALAEAVKNCDYPAALKAADILSNSITDYATAAHEMLSLLRDALVIQCVSDSQDLLVSPPSDYQTAKNLSVLPQSRLLSLCSVCQDEGAKIKSLGGRRTDFEIFLFKLCSPLSVGSIEAYEERLFELERKLSGMSAVPIPPVAVPVPVNKEAAAPKQQKKALQKEAPSDKPTATRASFWAEVRAKLEPSVASVTDKCDIKENGDEIIFYAKGIAYKMLTMTDVMTSQIKTVAAAVTGRDIRLTVNEADAPSEDAFDTLRENSGITFLD